MEQLISFLQRGNGLGLFPGAEEGIDPVGFVIFHHPVVTHALVPDLHVVSLHGLHTGDHGGDHRIGHHCLHTVHNALLVYLGVDAAEVQNVIEGVGVAEIVAVEVVLGHAAGVLGIGEGQAHAFQREIGELPAGKAPLLARAQVVGLAPEAFGHPVLADVGHADAAFDGGGPFQHVVGRLVEDDRFLARALGAGILAGLADGHPVFEAALKDLELAEHLADSIVVVYRGVDGVAAAAHLDRVLAVAGLGHGAHIDKVDVVGVGLVLDGLDDGHCGADVGAQRLFRIFVGGRGDHGPDMQHVVGAGHAAADAVKVPHVAPDHFQEGMGHLLDQGAVFVAGAGQHPYLEARGPGQQLFDGLLPHGAGASGDKDGLGAPGDVGDKSRVVHAQGSVKGFPGGVHSPAGSGSVAQGDVTDAQLPAGVFQFGTIPLAAADGQHGPVAGIFHPRAVLFADDLARLNGGDFHLGHRGDARLVDVLGDADLAGGAQVGAKFLHHFQVGDGAALFSKELGHLHAHHAAANDHHLAGHAGLAGQHVMAVGHMGQVGAGNVGDQRFGADAVEHHVGFDAADEFGRYRRVQPDVHAHLLHLAAHIHHGVGHFLLAGGLAGQHELAAQGSGSLTQNGVMALLLQDAGRLHTGDAAARDEHRLGRVGLFHGGGALGLPADGGVAQAGDVGHVQVGKTVQAALIAAHAAVNILYPAFLALVAEVRVGQLGTAHDHQIHLVRFQDVLRLLGVVDAPHADGEHTGLFADAGGVVHVEATGQVQGRHLVLACRRDHVAAGNVQHVHSGLARHLAEGNGVLDGHAVFQAVVVGVDAHEQGHILWHGGPDGPDALQREPGTVFQAAAVLVGAVVDTARQEGVWQIVVGAVELDAVKPGSHSPGGSLAVAVHDLVDHAFVDAGDLEPGSQFHLAGQQDHGGLVHAHGQAALPQLDARLAPRGVDGVGELLHTGDVLVITQGQEHFGGAQVVDAGDLHDVQRAAALGTGHMVVDVGLVDESVLGEPGAHGRQDDTVFQRQSLDGDGRKQFWVHSMPPLRNFSHHTMDHTGSYINIRIFILQKGFICTTKTGFL